MPLRVPGSPTPSKSLLGRIAEDMGKNAYAADLAEMQKQQRKDDKAASPFIGNALLAAAVARKLGAGPYQRLISHATVSFREAVVLSGIPEKPLRSAVLNVFKLQNTDQIPLLSLADLAGRETVAALVFPYRESYQRKVKNYIEDVIKEEYASFFLTMFSAYFDMADDEAKYLEASLAVIAGYLRMYPLPASTPSATSQSPSKGLCENPPPQATAPADLAQEEEAAPGSGENTIAPEYPFTVRNRVAVTSAKACGRKTREENSDALEWVQSCRKNGRSDKEIAEELFKAGAGNAVIGYLMAPNSEDLSEVDTETARKRGRRLRGLEN